MLSSFSVGQNFQMKKHPLRPLIFLDIDDVIATSLDYSSADIIAALKHDKYHDQQIWARLFHKDAKANIKRLHEDFYPQFIINSNWSTFLSIDQMKKVFDKTDLGIVSKSMHKNWATNKSLGASKLIATRKWLIQNRKEFHPYIIIDDRESGWTMINSDFDHNARIVWCDHLLGFNDEKYLEARKKMENQISHKPKER